MLSVLQKSPLASVVVVTTDPKSAIVTLMAAGDEMLYPTSDGDGLLAILRRFMLLTSH